VILSLTALTAFNGFSNSVNRSLLSDARTLHAADIIIRSYEEMPAPLAEAVADEQRQGRVQSTTYYEFYSVVRAGDEQKSLLALLKVVEAAYPFYGEVRLQSGRGLQEVLTAGQAVVAQSVLDVLGIQVGSRLKVGFTSLMIADVVLSEPDRPVNLFAFGPRIFIAASDLEALGLMDKGSRIRHVTLLKVADQTQLESIADRLRGAAGEEQASVDTFQSARSGFKRFLDNFIFFLKLVGLFILVIAGFGIQGTLAAFLAEKRDTIAIMKAVGATNRTITRHYILIAFLLGAIGIALGLAAGIGVQYGLARMLASILPPDMPLKIAWPAVAEGILMGLGVVALFSFVPLYRLRDLRPVMILRRDAQRTSPKWPQYLSAAALLLFFFALVLWHMQEVKIGLYFVGGIGVLIGLSWLITHLMLTALKRLPIGGLGMRQAAKGLFRPGNATRPIMITLTASLSAIFLITLIERNLDASFVQSYPPDSPNVFFLDIQPSQREDFSRLVARDVRFYPIVRARITAVNDEAVDRGEERRSRRDNLGRVFNLTYRQELLPDEKIVKGESLFRRDGQETQVSIMDTVTEMRAMTIGDTITFNIQGVSLKARIASIRTRTRESLSPFFYFVFEEKTLENAPQTLFTALKVDQGHIGALRSRIVAALPNISVIDISDTLQVFGKLLKRLSRIVRFFSMLSIAAGILILISAVFATRAARMAESVYYKILGARKRFVFRVFALENLLMGALSGLLALITAQAGGYLLCRFYFDIPYRPFLPACVLMLAATLLLVIAIGMVSSRGILAKKPVVYLREQTNA
jgi:putative ABC transport system permease protein